MHAAIGFEKQPSQSRLQNNGKGNTSAQKQCQSAPNVDMGNSTQAVKELTLKQHGDSIRAFSTALADLKLGNGSRCALELQFEKIRKRVFGFLSPQVFQVNVADGAGIVMCLGNGKKDKGGGNGVVGAPNVAMAISTIQSIRFVLNSTLPIEIFYMGDTDLFPQQRTELLKISSVAVHDLSPYFTIQDSIKGWNMKPFAMLVSSFRHVILMDLDAVFLQKPDVILAYPKYLETGSLFFHDRTFGKRPQSALDRINKLVTRPTDLFSRLRLMNLQTSHELESGVVVIDKHKHLAGLAAACKLLDPDTPLFRPGDLFGDKEFFWIGFAIVGEVFAFANDYKIGEVGVASRIDRDGETLHQICSNNLFHVDEFDRPLWINGGLCVNKNKDNQKTVLLDMKEYFTEGDGVSLVNYCYQSKKEPIQLDQATVNVIRESGILYLEALKNQK